MYTVVDVRILSLRAFSRRKLTPSFSHYVYTSSSNAGAAEVVADLLADSASWISQAKALSLHTLLRSSSHHTALS